MCIIHPPRDQDSTSLGVFVVSISSMLPVQVFLSMRIALSNHKRYSSWNFFNQYLADRLNLISHPDNQFLFLIDGHLCY